MALKDITLGQYFPGNTLLHRLDPRTKLLFTVAYIVALFLAKHVVGYAVLFVLLAVLIAVSKVGIKSILRGMKPILIIVIITGLLNLFYTRGEGAPLVSFWIFTIYPEGIWAAVFMVLRIAMLITCTFLLTYTTSPILLTDGLEKLMGPLKTLHVPVHELSMMMSIALRFIPTLIEETDKIMSAQKARGADFDTGNLLQKAKESQAPQAAVHQQIHITACRRHAFGVRAEQRRLPHPIGAEDRRKHTLKFGHSIDFTHGSTPPRKRGSGKSILPYQWT